MELNSSNHALLRAAMEGNEDDVYSALDNGANINFKDKFFFCIDYVLLFTMEILLYSMLLSMGILM